MDRRQGQAFARRGLASGIAVALSLAGCGGHSNVQLSSGSAAVAGGSTISIGAQPRSAFGDLVFLGIMLGVVHGSEGFGARASSKPLLAIQPTQAAPEPDAGRTVHEQDCSRPIENPTANLKCR